MRLDDHLLAQAKQVARQTGQSLTSLISESLAEKIAILKGPRAAEPLELPTFKGDGLREGVSLDKSSDLLDLMERLDGTP